MIVIASQLEKDAGKAWAFEEYYPRYEETLKANVDQRTKVTQLTPLMFALKHGCAGWMITDLIRCGANLSLQDPRGDTVLHTTLKTYKWRAFLKENRWEISDHGVCEPKDFRLIRNNDGELPIDLFVKIQTTEMRLL